MEPLIESTASDLWTVDICGAEEIQIRDVSDFSHFPPNAEHSPLWKNRVWMNLGWNVPKTPRIRWIHVDGAPVVPLEVLLEFFQRELTPRCRARWDVLPERARKLEGQIKTDLRWLIEHEPDEVRLRNVFTGETIPGMILTLT